MKPEELKSWEEIRAEMYNTAFYKWEKEQSNKRTTKVNKLKYERLKKQPLHQSMQDMKVIDIKDVMNER